MNSSTKFKGWLLLGAGLVLIISVFLPYVSVSLTMLGDSETMSFRLFPSVSGIIILLMGGFAVFMPLAGIKNKSALYGSAIGIISAGLLYYKYTQLQNLEVANAKLVEVMSMVGTEFGYGDSLVNVELKAGFFIAIMAIIAVIGTSFIYNLSDDQ